MFISPHIDRLIELGLDEDQVGFDISSTAFFENEKQSGRIDAKEPIVIAGLDILRRVYTKIDPAIQITEEAVDGDTVENGQTIASVEGPSLSILRGERLALNFVQRLSGIATKTAHYVERLDNKDIHIVDTRKTLPGYRQLDKYAVRCGGGYNHRYNLSGGVMIKDNHIAASEGDISEAVARAREAAPPTLKIEVEAMTIDEVQKAVEAEADIVMLDNMSTAQMSEAIEFIRDKAGKDITIEASGNITESRLPELRPLDLDIVSVGALTHSVEAADISMRLE